MPAWAFPDPETAGPGEVVAVGADLAPGTLLDAYRAGLFPMRLAPGGPLGWWSPEPRGILPLDGLVVHRSLRRSARRFGVTVDAAFTEVMRGCADHRRPGGWIDDEFVAAYTRLHELGWAHSVEVWRDGPDGPDGPTLVGGCYGVAIGGLFAGESMFHRMTDASKVALWAMVEAVRAGGGVLFDVQWATPHLTSLGVVEVSRAEYTRRLTDARARPQMRIGPVVPAPPGTYQSWSV